MENYIGKGVLVVVDFQYDFCNKKGSLYVKGAEKAKEAILNRINHDEFNQVIFTMDWHNFYDESFEVNGGQWPVHCVTKSPSTVTLLNAPYSSTSNLSPL